MTKKQKPAIIWFAGCTLIILSATVFDIAGNSKVSTANTACSQNNTLKLVFIRHGEKPDDGDNLNCQGLSRSMLLPGVLFKNFGKPSNIYIPSPDPGRVTKRARMLQTITPFVAKYNLNINSQYHVKDQHHDMRWYLWGKGIPGQCFLVKKPIYTLIPIQLAEQLKTAIYKPILLMREMGLWVKRAKEKDHIDSIIQTAFGQT